MPLNCCIPLGTHSEAAGAGHHETASAWCNTVQVWLLMQRQDDPNEVKRRQDAATVPEIIEHFWHRFRHR